MSQKLALQQTYKEKTYKEKTISQAFSKHFTIAGDMFFSEEHFSLRATVTLFLIINTS